ncbi:ROK family protein [Acetobacteraceae bacterium H6797]|nr:ROK family protein [Acetobacteraceae bacterium H6797]
MYCADIGGSFVKLGIADKPGEMRSLGQVPNPTRDWPALVSLLREFTASAPPGMPLAISIAGPVDPVTHVVPLANIPCADGRRLGPELEVLLDRPVLVANDADCFALAEAMLGSGKGHPVVFGIILGTGVGGGLVANGRLVRGAGGITGEWGHGPIQPRMLSDGTRIEPFRCGCGRMGCTDAFGSARGLEKTHVALGCEPADSRAIIDAWQTGQPEAARSVRAYVEMLAGPLGLAINLTGASVVPVGGGLGGSAPLLAALNAELAPRIFHKGAPILVPATHGNMAGLLGASLLGSGAL